MTQQSLIQKHMTMTTFGTFILGVNGTFQTTFGTFLQFRNHVYPRGQFFEADDITLRRGVNLIQKHVFFNFFYGFYSRRKCSWFGIEI